jgi:hypothetical protein
MGAGVVGSQEQLQRKRNIRYSRQPGKGLNNEAMNISAIYFGNRSVFVYWNRIGS